MRSTGSNSGGKRARWALDLTLDEDSTTRAVGFRSSTPSPASEYASEHEAEVIDGRLISRSEAVAAATVTVDRKLGKRTAAWVQDLAAGQGA